VGRFSKKIINSIFNHLSSATLEFGLRPDEFVLVCAAVYINCISAMSSNEFKRRKNTNRLQI